MSFRRDQLLGGKCLECRIAKDRTATLIQDDHWRNGDIRALK